MEIVMSKFKVGDEVVLVAYDKERDDEKSLGFYIGCKYKISDVGLCAKIENENDFIYVDYHQIKISDSYKTSNRNKLREHIKSLGSTAIDLSLAAGFNKYYFGSETAESKFNKRGDISDKRFNELKAIASSAKVKLSRKLFDDFKGIGFSAKPKDEELSTKTEVIIQNYGTDKEITVNHLPNKKIFIELKDIEIKNQDTKPEKLKSKWIVSNKVFFTFVFFVSLLILFIATGVVKQVF